MGLGSTLTLRFKMRPEKMALWNELLPSLQEIARPSTASHIPTTSEKQEDGKGVCKTIFSVFLEVIHSKKMEEKDIICISVQQSLQKGRVYISYIYIYIYIYTYIHTYIYILIFHIEYISGDKKSHQPGKKNVNIDKPF